MTTANVADAASKRIGVVCIAPVIDSPASMEFPVLYEAIGKNTGNFMFTQAMFRHLAGDVRQIGFGFDPDRVNAEFDCVVVPAANWLNARSDWDWFTPLIDRLEIPVITIGIGVQADSPDPRMLEVNDSCRRLIHTLARKSPFISTRGHFTTGYLHSLGVMNAVTTGCPSLYMSFPKSDRADGDGGVVIQSTRYAFSEAFAQSTGVNSALFKIATQINADIVFQSEPEEIEFLIYDNDAVSICPERARGLAGAYGLPDTNALLDYLRAHGHVFFNVDEWSQYISRKSAVFGTRLHGSIIALNSGVPAVLFSHDSRTAETIEFARIPTQVFKYEAGISEEQHREQINDAVQEYRELRDHNSIIYKNFLSACGLQFAN